MKKIILSLLIVFVGLSAKAQQDNFPKKETRGETSHGKSTHRPIFYIIHSVLNNAA